MALLIWAGLHHVSALCSHLVCCLWTHWSRMASLSVHSAAYRADLVSGETHKDGMAQTVGTLPHTLGSPQLVGSPCPPPPQVSCALCFVAEEWPQGIFSRVPLGFWSWQLWELHPPFFFFFPSWLLCAACMILVPQPGIELRASNESRESYSSDWTRNSRMTESSLVTPSWLLLPKAWKLSGFTQQR